MDELQRGGLWYTPYEFPISAKENDRKLDVEDRKLEGSHSSFRGQTKLNIF